MYKNEFGLIWKSQGVSFDHDKTQREYEKCRNDYFQRN